MTSCRRWLPEPLVDAEEEEEEEEEESNVIESDGPPCKAFVLCNDGDDGE